MNATTSKSPFVQRGKRDTSQIVLENKKCLLFDFCRRADSENPENELLGLKRRLHDELKTAGRDRSPGVSPR